MAEQERLQAVTAHAAAGSPGHDPPEQNVEKTPELSEQKPRAPQAEKARGSPLKWLLIKLALVAAIFAVMFLFVMGLHIQHGNRMYPFIMDGDLVVTYKLEPYRVGDVVVYRNPDTGETALSRIVAIGENTIQITDYGELLVNGVSPSEKVFHPNKPLEGAALEYPYAMRRGGYFVLDDFRTEGSDSRLFGQLQESDLKGKVVYVFRRRGI